MSLFRELTELMILSEGGPQTFRVRAYENATNAIQSAREDLSQLSESALAKLDGIGKSTAQKIREYFDSGKIERLEELRAEFPADFVALGRIPGLGPKTLIRLRDELGVRNLGDLKAAITTQKIRVLKGMGAKTEEKLAKAVERIGAKQDRRPIGDALPLADALVAELSALEEVESVQYCGSLRRFRETIADIDLVVASRDPTPIMEFFVGMPRVKEVLGHGDTKSSVVTDIGIQVDLRVVEPEQYGAALLYFTGSKAHNIKLRQRAIDRGLTLNEYGLVEVATGKVLASKQEADIYRALDLDFIAPELREDTGEILAAAEHSLPHVANVEDLRGDLHVHTDFSGDAHSSVEDIVKACAARSYEYVALTDHGVNLPPNGVAQKDYQELRKRAAKLRKSHPDLTILLGCELNIGPSGELDYDEDFRKSLDFCVASVHSHFELDRARQTARFLAAINDPSVDVLGHLTARIIGQRPPIELDVDEVLRAAAEAGVALEINSGLHRLDAPEDILRRALELGLLFTISSDAHRAERLDNIRYGIRHSHRAWLPAERVVNTWPRKDFLAWTRRRRTA